MGQVHKLWKIKQTSSSTIFKTIYHDGSYLNRDNKSASWNDKLDLEV